MAMIRQYGTMLFFSLAAYGINAQTIREDTVYLKNKIETLFEKKNILEINRIIYDNRDFDPQYTFKILTNNLNYVQKKGNAKELASTYFTLGNFWLTRGNKTKAYENYLKSESVADADNDIQIKANALRNRATLISNPDERIRVLQKTIELFEQIEDKRGLAVSHLNMGIAYSLKATQTNNTIKQMAYYKEIAFRHYKTAESLNQYLKNDGISAALHTYYAEWFLFEGKLEEARKSYLEVIEYFTRAKMLKGKVNALLELAHIEVKQQRFNNAFEFLKEAKELSESQQFNDHLVTVYEKYSVLYDSLGDISKALEYNKLYASKALEQSEINNESKIQIASLEHSLAENQLKLEKSEAKTKFNRIVSSLSILILLFIVGVFVLVYKNNRKKIESLEKSKIITEIQFKNQQLEDKLLKEKVSYSQNHLITVANLSNKILKFLDELKIQVKELSHNSAYQQGINDLRISFSKILNDRSYLAELNSLSSELNHEFFIYVRKNYPEITKNDEQLLSYIILNMSSKEIGKLFNISTESVYIKRHRLRKKLALDNNDSILKFYEKVIAQLN